jgi:hypothetical protein
VCAAISCPTLINEAYEGYKLNEQLKFNSYIFFRDTNKNRFDLNTKTAYISKILDWYSEDFGNSDAEIIKYVAQFAPLDVKDSMLNESDKWKIEYMDYDWTLNDIKNKP